jgi:hypothetical protein
VTQSNNKEWWFSSLFRIAGYGLLVLSFFDIIDTFFPPNFTDPAWELGVVRNLVERVPVPLIGVVLVFSSETNLRIFKLLSKACLVVAILYLLLVPLGITSALRIDQKNQQQFVSLINQRTVQIQQVRDLLSKATTAQDITQLLARLNPQGPVPQINNPQQAKSQLTANLNQAEKRAKSDIAAQLSSARLNLFEKTLKLMLEAVVSAIIFFSLWRSNSRAIRR